MPIQLPLFPSFERVQNLPLVRKYETLFSMLDRSHIPLFDYSIGADGKSQHALLRAFLIRSLEGLKTVAALMAFLEANPALKYLCGFRNSLLPHNAQFDRFLKKTNHFTSKTFLCAPPHFSARKGYGCTAYRDLTDDARSRVQCDMPQFKNSTPAASSSSKFSAASMPGVHLPKSGEG